MHKFSVFVALFSLFLPVAVFADLDPCEITKLNASDGTSSDYFGISVSISGDCALIGARESEAYHLGAGYIFRRNGTIWTEEAKLTASDWPVGSLFGSSVSISGDYALIGAYGDDEAHWNGGAAYIFHRTGTSWTEEAKLMASNPARDDQFGYSVFISGDYAIIGAVGGLYWKGKAYIFRRTGTVWTEEARLTASDGINNNHFGCSVSISGDYALTGAYGDNHAGDRSGSAYIFRRTGTIWTEEAKLTASDGAAYDWFGRSVSISGDYALIGAWNNNSAYIFRRSGTTWTEEAKLTPSDGGGGSFGRSVSIIGDYALIGDKNGDGVVNGSGAAYVFKKDGTTWTEEAKLIASDGEWGEYFGWSVAFNGDYALIGATRGDSDQQGRGGAAYVYGLSGAACGRRILAGPGPGYANAPLMRIFPPEQDATHDHEFAAYGQTHYGVNVTCGDVTGDGFDKILTSPGPGPIFGPHVRGFEMDGTPLPGLSFIAYGTRKWGANVACGDIDDDGFDEIITGPGPGAVFGPHVRAFDYDGTPSITPVPGVSFFAYGTRKWGVNISGGDIDSDGFDEIITGPGPGAVFGPHVRGWDVDGGTASAIPTVSYFAYSTQKWGVAVTCGNVDGDGFDEIVTAPGPSWFFGTHIRGWNYDNVSISSLPGCSFLAWPSADARYGARVYAGGDLDLDIRHELVVGCGPDPSVGSEVKVFKYDGAVVVEWFSLQAFPSGWTHGTNVAAGRF